MLTSENDVSVLCCGGVKHVCACCMGVSLKVGCVECYTAIEGCVCVFYWKTADFMCLDRLIAALDELHSEA